MILFVSTLAFVRLSKMVRQRCQVPAQNVLSLSTSYDRDSTTNRLYCCSRRGSVMRIKSFGLFFLILSQNACEGKGNSCEIEGCGNLVMGSLFHQAEGGDDLFYRDVLDSTNIPVQIWSDLHAMKIVKQRDFRELFLELQRIHFFYHSFELRTRSIIRDSDTFVT